MASPALETQPHTVAMETNVGNMGEIFQERVDMSCAAFRKFDGVSG